MKKTLLAALALILSFIPVFSASASGIIPQKDKIYSDLAAMASAGLIKSVTAEYISSNAITETEAASYIYEADSNIGKASAQDAARFSAAVAEYKKRFAALQPGAAESLVVPASSKLDSLVSGVADIEKSLPDYVMGDTSRVKITGILNFKSQNLTSQGVTKFNYGSFGGSLMQVAMNYEKGDMKIGCTVDLEDKKNDPAAGTSNIGFNPTTGFIDSYDMYLKMFGWNLTGGMLWEDITQLTASQGPSDRPWLFDRDKYAGEEDTRTHWETMFRNYFQSLDYRWP